MKRYLPGLSPSADWSKGYWTGIALGILIGGCGGAVVGMAL